MTHEKPVLSAAFNPDGRYLATASSDGTARVWDMNSGCEISRIAQEEQHDSYYSDSCHFSRDAIYFSPDGRQLVMQTAKTRGWLWRPDDLIAEARSRLTRNLTEEEWRRFVGDEPYRKLCPDLP